MRTICAECVHLTRTHGAPIAPWAPYLRDVSSCAPGEANVPLPFSLGDANLSVRFDRSLARMVRYELVFIIEAKDDTAARRAANKAWSALDDATGVAVKDSSARRRARNGRPVAVGWKDWQEEPTFSFRIYE